MIRPAEDLAPYRAEMADWPELGTPPSLREGWRPTTPAAGTSLDRLGAEGCGWPVQDRQREVTQRRLRLAARRLDLGFALP
ncbi:hypothetical protein ACIBW9_18345 [Streptomyces sp. NPDC049541]|uniref:hypothetical protein n=1 Tax=Streptomyces sp. NPDC049541 TaxID=3365594 RepID=UPI0037A7DD12